VLWTVASLVTLWLLRFSPGLLQTFKLELLGTDLICFRHPPLSDHPTRIYKASKPATQSGTWHGHHWRMDWDILQKGHRWENPLMGWQSSGDYMQGTHLNFKSKEDAILFAQKQGYEYFVQEPNERRFVPKAYANNFVHEPKKLKHIRTK
jgi:NADH dehydrogenase (ubiquinone) Fe-S protein 4